MKKKRAIFAGGCFWGVEDKFSNTKGVISATSGYTGGHTKNPSYEDVCGGDTGHAEAVEVTFDSDKISYEDLLDIFWKLHDPTTINRQGPDVGSQYRSAIFYIDASQKKKAEESLKKEGKRIGKKVVTEITKAGVFYPAEEYHQRYFKKNGGGVCGI